jgi:hypothetical protein
VTAAQFGMDIGLFAGGHAVSSFGLQLHSGHFYHPACRLHYPEYAVQFWLLDALLM